MAFHNTERKIPVGILHGILLTTSRETPAHLLFEFRRATVNTTASFSQSSHLSLFISLYWNVSGCYIYRNNGQIRAEEHTVVLVSWAYRHLFGESWWYYIWYGIRRRVLCLLIRQHPESHDEDGASFRKMRRKLVLGRSLHISH